MAEITRDTNNNNLEIYEGFHKSKFRDEMEYIPVSNSSYELIRDKKKITGVKLNNFFETVELASYKAENEMKKVFEAKNYKSLYTGSFLQISEKSSGFYLNIGNSRPDFLVKIPSVGQIFIDVKCRRLYEVEKSEEEKFRYFSLNKEEIYELFEIQKNVDIPVWVSIKDFSFFDKERSRFTDNVFYMAPISLLYKFVKRINSYVGKKKNQFYTYKIPADLFTEVKNFSSLSFSESIATKQVRSSAELMLNSVTETKEVINKVLKKEKTYKTYLPYILGGYYSENSKISEYNGVLNHLTPQDINSVLWTMITEKQVLYTKGKPLVLNACKE